MQVKLFYRTQRDLAVAVNQLVDAYWDEKINEEKLIDGIKNMHSNNEDKLRKTINLQPLFSNNVEKDAWRLLRKF